LLSIIPHVPATSDSYTLSLHDALPISLQSGQPWNINDQSFDFSGTGELADRWNFYGNPSDFKSQGPNGLPYFPGTSNSACAQKRSEEHTSELQSHLNLVCRLLLEKKKT